MTPILPLNLFDPEFGPSRREISDALVLSIQMTRSRLHVYANTVAARMTLGEVDHDSLAMWKAEYDYLAQLTARFNDFNHLTVDTAGIFHFTQGVHSCSELTMPTSQECKVKIATAEVGCQEVTYCLDKALSSLKAGCGRNAYGVFSSPHDVRARIELAHSFLSRALYELEQVRFPTDSDYDAL